MSQIQSAKRSLTTNLICISLFLIGHTDCSAASSIQNLLLRHHLHCCQRFDASVDGTRKFRNCAVSFLAVQRTFYSIMSIQNGLKDTIVLLRK
jgi:hypothetical protein